MSRILLNRLFGRETTSMCNFCNKKIRRSLSDNKKSIIKPAVQQREYAFFHRVLESLPQNRSLAFAYGSGVFKQDGQSWTRNSMSDFIIVTDDPLKWHKDNLRQNPAHYPSAMRYLGHEAIARLQTDFGAKIYFNTLIPFEDGKIKYGVISTEDLIVDLLEWKTLYVSGRLHKPVNILEIDSSNQTLKQGLRANLIYALHAALIQLPSSFQEEDLYLALAGISYTGDLRMLIGEDKNKVSNIVTAQGELFKHLYSKSLATLSDRVHVSDGTITQDTSEEGRYHQLTMLPSTLKRKISEKWNKEGRELDLEEVFLKAIKDPTLTTKIVREGIQTIVQESSSPQPSLDNQTLVNMEQNSQQNPNSGDKVQEQAKVEIPETRESMSQRTLQVSRVIVKVSESSQVVEEILQAGQPIGLDLEGVNLGPKGRLTLVQVGTMAGQVILFDVQANPALFAQGGLSRLIQSENIVKVVHDCRNDSGALYHQHGITINNVFDTQAAHVVLTHQNTGKPVSKVNNVSLNHLCELYEGPTNPLKDEIKNIYRRDQAFWARRPLSQEMICYAADDVLALVPAIYNCLDGEIKPEFRNLFHALCEEIVLQYIRPDEVKERRRQRKVDAKVAELEGTEETDVKR